MAAAIYLPQPGAAILSPPSVAPEGGGRRLFAAPFVEGPAGERGKELFGEAAAAAAAAMTGRGTPSRFLASVLRNGVGRYLVQLQRLTLTLSRDAQSSRGAREYIEEKVVDFARQNPGIVVYVTPKKCRVPTVVAEYLNGTVKEETLTSKTADEIAQIIYKLANQSGLENIRIRKPFHTDNPSIQGQWHPFTNKPSVLNVQNVGQRCLPSAKN